MSPHSFGQKIAAELRQQQSMPTAAVKQPMEKAIATTAKSVPAMLNMARSNNQNVISILNPLSAAVKTRTGEHPSNWEMHEILAQGLPYPQSR